jgi:hypothetical protein
MADENRGVIIAPTHAGRRSGEAGPTPEMKILFLHGWNSAPGGVKPTYLANPEGAHVVDVEGRGRGGRS